MSHPAINGSLGWQSNHSSVGPGAQRRHKGLTGTPYRDKSAWAGVPGPRR